MNGGGAPGSGRRPVDTVDLRSDTVTRPTAGMRAAMAQAQVGDDAYGEDPSVNALQERAAGLFGMAAGVFMPSGTMANQVALSLLVPPGAELLCDADAHVVSYESGAAARHSGIQTRTLCTSRGILDPAEVAAQVRLPGYGTVPTAALAVEQTHNRAGGIVYPAAVLDGLRAVVDATGMRLHGDGARIWHAHVATGLSLDACAQHFDTLSVCLSKGLGAPVGSLLLLRDPAQLPRALMLRRAFGGTLRQAGILAAAGLYAMEHHVARLADDHDRARRVAELMDARVPGVVDPSSVETNVVVLDLAGTDADAAAVANRASGQGVLVGQLSPRRIRLVTHLDVTDDGVERAAAVLADAIHPGVLHSRDLAAADAR